MAPKLMRACRAGFAALVFLATAAGLSGCGKAQPTAPPIVFATETSTAGSAITIVPVSKLPLADNEPDPADVTLESVGIAAEGGYIVVYFIAPPEVAGGWWQGSVYVMDERTGVIYAEVPVMPVVGPLFAKPKEAGQQGYCMLTNTGGGIRNGSVVTVVLGSYRREHITVQ
jgi:hypothetical protein